MEIIPKVKWSVNLHLRGPLCYNSVKPKLPLFVSYLRSWGGCSLDQITDSAWAERVKLGDQAAFKLLFRKHAGWVYNKAYRMLKNHEDAEEVCQDVFMKVWTKINLWDPKQGSFQTWLNEIAKNTIIDACATCAAIFPLRICKSLRTTMTCLVSFISTTGARYVISFSSLFIVTCLVHICLKFCGCVILLPKCYLVFRHKCI